jgi:hypothetical protein
MPTNFDIVINKQTGEVIRGNWPRRPVLDSNQQITDWEPVPSPDYLINPDVSALETADVPEKYWKVVGDTVVKMTAQEKATKETSIRGPLDEQKKQRRLAVNARTGALIAAGYEYPPGSGVYYSLSDTAQRNLAELEKKANSQVYPFDMASQDDTVIASVVNAAEVAARYTAGLGRIQWAYATGNALKKAINAAATQAALDAVVDSR